MSERIGIIKDIEGKIINVVVWGDESAEQFARDGLDAEEVTNEPIRPGIGWLVRNENGQRKFRTPKPFDSWVEDEGNGWRAPVDPPDNDMIHEWDEETGSWISHEPPAPVNPEIEYINQLINTVMVAPTPETKAIAQAILDSNLESLQERDPQAFLSVKERIQLDLF